MSVSRSMTLACATVLLVPVATAAAADPASQPAEPGPVACTSTGDGYLKARIAGAVSAEINWGNSGTTCTGEVRPRGGVRLSFKNKIGADQTLLIVFGIPGVQEGRAAQALTANVTVVREGSAEFYSTQGDDKCTIDRLEQQPIQGAPHKKRRYRVVARGFCSEPARAVQGEGAVLLSRFDFASELLFEDEPAETADPTTLAGGGLPRPDRKR